MFSSYFQQSLGVPGDFITLPLIDRVIDGSVWKMVEALVLTLH